MGESAIHPRITKLRLPPRSLPFGVWCAILPDWTGFFWVVFASFWVVFLCFFSGDRSPDEILMLRLLGHQAEAMVEAVVPSDAWLGGSPINRVLYSFLDDSNRRVQAIAYDRDPWRSGDKGTAVFLPSKSDICRLWGKTQQPFGLFGYSLWFLPLGALVFGAPSWRRSILEAFLLMVGSVTDARVTGCRRLKGSKEGVEICRYFYEFETKSGRVMSSRSDVFWDEGSRTPIYEKSPQCLIALPPESAPLKPLLYLRSMPSVSALVDSLPLRYGLGVDGKGYWTAHPRALQVARFAAAALTSAAAVASVIAYWAGALPDLGR